MKLRPLLLLSVCMYFMQGCTSTFVKTDFSSETVFFKEINESSGSVDIILKNDSTFSADRLKAGKDSVMWEQSGYERFNDLTSRFVKRASIPINDVKAITFSHHWGANILNGMYYGALSGAVAGAFLLEISDKSVMGDHPHTAAGAIPGALGGVILGAITAIIAGDDELFVLDNSSSEFTLKGLNSRHKFGLKVGMHSGFNYNIILQEGHNSANNSLNGNRIPSPVFTLYYNCPLGRMLSMNTEFSYASIGSDAHYSVKLPPPGNSPASKYQNAAGSSEEYTKMLELAPLVRLNLFRSHISSYLLIGPRFDFLFPGESGISNFLTSLENNYETKGVTFSSRYNSFVAGATFGTGISTGSLFPVEFLIEARYSFDFSPRFEMEFNPNGYKDPNAWFYNGYYDSGNMHIKYRSREFQLNVGAAIF